MTDRLTEAELHDIINGTEGVTPGPYSTVPGLGEQDGKEVIDAYLVTFRHSGDELEVCCCTVWPEPTDAEKDARHFARCDPATIRAMAEEILALRRANSTIPDYDLHCEECGRAHILDTVIPSEIWNQIADPANVLCTICIDRRLTAKGLTAEAEFYFTCEGLSSKLYAASYGELAFLQREILELREALAPFAAVLEGDQFISNTAAIPFDAFRRARAALENKP